MNTPINFCCLLLRGTGLSKAEQACVRNVYKELGKKQFYLQMENKKILPFAANTLVSCNLDPEYWQEILNQYRQRNQAILRELDTAYKELARQGVKKMFVSENFGALLSSGNDLALFTSGDVDNHADLSEKENIYRAFDILGYTRKERYTGGLQIAAEFFPPQTENLPEKFYIRVDFYPLERINFPCFIRSAEFIEWEQLFCYQNTAIKLPPTNALMYICMLHLSLHSFSRAPDIRLYIDLLYMSSLNVDYEQLAIWCNRDKTCTRAAVAAKLSNALMNTKFSDTITSLSDKAHKVISLVYDATKNDLRYELRGLKILQVEICCNDRGVLSGIWEVLFPDKQWLKQVYGNNSFVSYMKHFIDML